MSVTCCPADINWVNVCYISVSQLIPPASGDLMVKCFTVPGPGMFTFSCHFFIIKHGRQSAQYIAANQDWSFSIGGAGSLW